MTSEYVYVVDDTLLAAGDRMAGAMAKAMGGEEPTKVHQRADLGQAQVRNM